MFHLSVAICTYNGSLYIQKQLDSILSQDLPVDEIIICDDDSSDDTLKIITSIANKNGTIKWVIERNPSSLGVTKNFEKALSLCTGDLIFLSDQDDVWMSNKTSKIVDYFEKHGDVNLVFTNAELIDESGSLKTDKTLFDACGLSQLKEQWNLGLQFEIENVIQRLLGATFALRREFVKACLPFDCKLNNYHDGQLAMNSVVQNCNGMIDECLIQYRIHGNNVVGLGGERNWVFSGSNRPNEFANLIEPRPINPFFLTSKADKIRDRVEFFQKRIQSYQTVKGKISLLLLYTLYKKYYKKYWMKFFISDLMYGISSNMRNRIISL